MPHDLQWSEVLHLLIFQTPGENPAGYGLVLTSRKMGFTTELSVKYEPVLAACSCLIPGHLGLFFLLTLLHVTELLLVWQDAPHHSLGIKADTASP